MANVYKPQQPLNKNGSYLFPRTTVDQVYYDAPKGKMLDAKLDEMDAATEEAAKAAAAATDYSNGTATVDATNTTSGNVFWHKYGRLVQVNVNDIGLKLSVINGTTWKAYTVATGLPAPAGGGTGHEHLYIEAAQSNAGRFRIGPDGSLIYYHHDADLIRGAKEDTAAASGVITYIAAE